MGRKDKTITKKASQHSSDEEMMLSAANTNDSSVDKSTEDAGTSAGEDAQFDWHAIDDDVEYSANCQHSKNINFPTVRKALRSLKAFPKCQGCELSGDKADDTGNEGLLPEIVLCLVCGNVGCGRYVQGHAVQHYESPTKTGSHELCYNVAQDKIWCYACDAWVKAEGGKLGDTVKQLQEFIKKWTKTRKKSASSDVNSRIDAVVNGYDGHVIDKPEQAKVHKTSKSNGPVLTKQSSDNDNGVHTQIKGLQNLGNTCFFNSVAQCLCQTHPILYLIDKMSGEKTHITLVPEDERKYPRISVDLPDVAGSSPLLVAFASFVRTFQTQNGKSSTLNPGSLFSQIVRKAPRFKGYQQQDSHELLRYLLDGLRFEESRRLQSAIKDKLDKQIKQLTDVEKHEIVKAYERAGEPYLVDRVFGGKLLQSIYCRQCRRYSNTFEPFLDLSLPIDDQKNVAPHAAAESDDDETGSNERSAAGGGGCSKHQLKKLRRKQRTRNRRKSSSSQSNQPESPADEEVSAVTSSMDAMSVSDCDEAMHEDQQGEEVDSGCNSDDDEDDDAGENEEASNSLNNSASLLRRLRPADTTAYKSECHIGSCLAAFMKIDYLTGKNQFGCELCYADEVKRNPKLDQGTGNRKQAKPKVIYTDAEKSYLIYKPPAVLTIHLKRFQQRGFMTQKWSKAVEFPLLLDLSPYMSAKAEAVTPGASKVLYSLFGVVSHAGSMRGGHYVNYVKLRNRHDGNASAFLRQEHNGKQQRTDINGNEPPVSPLQQAGTWYYCSDSHVSEVPLSRVLSAEAYILFYERIE